MRKHSLVLIYSVSWKHTAHQGSQTNWCEWSRETEIHHVDGEKGKTAERKWGGRMVEGGGHRGTYGRWFLL